MVCKIKKGNNPATMTDELEEDVAIVQKIYDVAISFAPSYDVKGIYEIIKLIETPQVNHDFIGEFVVNETNL